jgi:hypothetical protein
MKASKLYTAAVAAYVFNFLVCVGGINTNGWNYRTHPIVATTALVVTGGACALGGFAVCVVAGIADLLILVVSSFSKQHSGRAGYAIDQANRSDFQVWHDVGDGHVRDYLNTSMLEAGVEHPVWDSKATVDSRAGALCFQSSDRWFYRQRSYNDQALCHRR